MEGALTGALTGDFTGALTGDLIVVFTGVIRLQPHTFGMGEEATN